jgi:hypothetical protein
MGEHQGVVSRNFVAGRSVDLLLPDKNVTDGRGRSCPRLHGRDEAGDICCRGRRVTTWLGSYSQRRHVMDSQRTETRAFLIHFPDTQVIQDGVDQLADQNVDSTDTEIRYMAYGARLRTALRASTRYIAYVRALRLCLSRVINLMYPFARLVI